MIAHPHGAVEYQELGSGPAIVFVPGSFSTGATWRHVVKPLSERYRIITTSLLGYGDTQERRQPGSASIEDEVDVLQAVVAQANAPVHIVGHSFGAWVALVYAMRRQPQPLSLTLLEPPAPSLLQLAGETGLYRQFHAMTDAYITAWQNGDTQSARSVIDFYGGEGSFDAFPAHAREYVVAQTPTNLLDWECAYTDTPTREKLGRAAMPALLVYGEKSHPAVQRSNVLLSQWLPRASLVGLAGANHFMIGTHPAELSQLIERHITAADAN